MLINSCTSGRPIICVGNARDNRKMQRSYLGTGGNRRSIGTRAEPHRDQTNGANRCNRLVLAHSLARRLQSYNQKSGIALSLEELEMNVPKGLIDQVDLPKVYVLSALLRKG